MRLDRYDNSDFNRGALVEERFTWQTIAAQMREVYDWMLGGGTPPSSVIGSR
jgi:hypothetical protein